MSPMLRAARKQEQPHVRQVPGGGTALGLGFAFAKAILRGTITDALKGEYLPAGDGLIPL